MTDPAAPVDPRLVAWRRRVFAATWLSYFGYYFCRKPFGIVKSALGRATGFDAETLGYLGAAYSVAYAVGQFVAGRAGDRVGPRAVLLTGMAVSVGCSVAFGVTTGLSVFLGLMIVNGLAQATGWSGGVGTMGAWFRRRERGTVMGWWATNFQAGGLAAGVFAAWMLGRHGYAAAFVGGAVVLAAIWVVVLVFQRNRPQDVGLPPIVDEAPSPAATNGAPSDAPAVVADGRWPRTVVTSIVLVGSFYFFVKFIRYAIWSWVPFVLERNFHLSGESAGYLSQAFDAAGIAGAIVTGLLSDRLFGGRRALISFLMVLAMAGACALLMTVGTTSVVAFTVCLALVGFTLFGPDALMTGAAAIDIGSPQRAALAAGIINGMGQVGAVVQDLVIGRLLAQQGDGLGPILALLFGSAAMAALFLGVILWRNRRGLSDV